MKTETAKIEENGYVATAADIEHLAQVQATYINASRWQLPATYLRALIATTQAELGIKSIKRNPPKPSDETIILHLEALANVQEQFYEAVKRGAAKAPMDPEDTRDKVDIISSRVVFARSAYSTVRAWILRGRFGLEGLNPKHATKQSLYDATPRPERIRTPGLKALTRQADKILSAIRVQAKSNREAAIETLQALITTLSRGFDDLGLPAVGLRESVDLTATQVVSEALARAAAQEPRPRGRPPNQARKGQVETQGVAA